MRDFLPYTRQSVDDGDIAAVAAVLRGDFLTTGPTVTAFEDALAERVGARHAVACSSGTAALHLAALALGLGPGDVAIVPAVTFVATANAARYAGAEVVLADVDPDTGLMRPDDLTAALDRAGPAAKAVFAVHLGGQPCDMAAIGAIARARGLAVVEDAAHALGTLPAEAAGGGAVGDCRFADMTIFSFHPAKTATTAEGGAVTANDAAIADRLRIFCTHGIVRDAGALTADADEGPWVYEQQVLGFNYRISDVHCALGLSQLGRLDEFLDRRARLVAAYDAALAPLAPTVRPVARIPSERTGWHLCQALVDFEAAGTTRARVMTRLRENGIGTQVHYIPVYRHPYHRGSAPASGLPGAEEFYRRTLSLPLFADMDEDDVARVVAELGKALA